MMPIDALPDDLDVLRALVSCLSSERDAAIEECRRVREQNDRLHHLLRQLQRAQFGRRSERLDHEQMQLALEDIETTIAEQDAQEDKKDTAETTAGAQRKKRCANRGSLPAHLPRIPVTLAPEIAACPCCHGAMHVIGEDTAERLDVIPAQYRVIVTHRPQYACRTCEQGVVQAPAPERLIKGGLPTEAMVASVLVAKYAWHLPLYRQAQMLLSQGITIERATLAFWVGYAAAELKPLYLRLRELDIAKGGSAPIASEALDRIAALYAIEKMIRGKSADERAFPSQDLVSRIAPCARKRANPLCWRSKPGSNSSSRASRRSPSLPKSSATA